MSYFQPLRVTEFQRRAANVLEKMICTHRVRMLAIAVLFLSSGCAQHRDYMDQGQQAYQQESYEAAISYFSKAVAVAPAGQEMTEGLRSLSKAYQAVGKGEEAAATLVRAMKVMKYCLENKASGRMARSHCPIPPWEET